MFKNTYTTRMSGNAKVLGIRFDKINFEQGKLGRIMGIICIFIITASFMLSTIVMANIEMKEEYNLEITNNDEVIDLENEPFVKDGLVYVPLRELFTKIGLMETERAKMEWNNGVILVNLCHKNLNEDAGSDYTSYMYKIEIGKNELIINPDELVNMRKSYEFVENMEGKPVFKDNITYIPFSFAKRLVERADNGVQSPPDRYELDFIYSGEVLSIAYPLAEEHKVTSKFGERIHPVTGEKTFHRGIDISAPEGAEVYGGIEGVIWEKAFDGEKGNYVTILNKKGVEVTYSHLSSFGDVYVGKAVEKFSLIGYVGNTGVSTGSHLEMSVKINGEYVNPQLYIEYIH